MRSKKPIKRVGKFIQEETKRVLKEVETQVIGGGPVRSQSVEKERDVGNEKAIKEEERKSQLVAARRRLREIEGELAAARQEISQERERKEEGEEERSLPIAQSFSPEAVSKPKSHMPLRIGVEKRKRR